VLLWTLGQCIDFFPTGTPRTIARSVHICTGALLAVILAARLRWLFDRRRLAPLAVAGMPGRLATWTHRALYLLLVAVVLLGMLNAWERGDSIFGLFRIPALVPDDKPLRERIEDLHALAANALVIVAALHAAAGLFHHFVLKDDVLRRMTGRRRPIR
jgi:cytochrome b561